VAYLEFTHRLAFEEIPVTVSLADDFGYLAYQCYLVGGIYHQCISIGNVIVGRPERPLSLSHHWGCTSCDGGNPTDVHSVVVFAGETSYPQDGQRLFGIVMISRWKALVLDQELHNHQGEGLKKVWERTLARNKTL